MAEISTMIPSPQFLQYVVKTLWEAKNLRLGIVSIDSPVNADQHLTDLAPIYAAEYDLSGWQRPTITIPTIASLYDKNTKTLNLPNLSWTVTSPAQGLTYYQLFVVIGGTASPHDTTGIFQGLTTQSSNSYINPNISFPVDISWSLLGFNQ
jgi:hypothetical protein